MCLYKRIFLDYTYGVGKICTAEETEKAKQSPSFEREYNLKYLGKIGNVFKSSTLSATTVITKDIEAAIEKVHIDGANPSFIKSLKLQIGEDPGYDKVIARYRSEGLGDSWSENMTIVPVNFKRAQSIARYCKMILERSHCN